MSCNRLVLRLSLPQQLADKVQRRGNELYRLSKLKMPTLGNFESCRAALCVEIALGDDMTSTLSKILIRLSTVNAKVYAQMMSRLQTLLGVRRGNSVKALRELALQFRCSGFLEFIKTTLKTYQQRFIQGLPKRRRKHADFSNPKYGAAALYLCAKKRRVKVDRFKLLAVVVTENGKFQDVLNSMTALCFDTIGTGQKQTALDVKQKRFLLDATKTQSSTQLAKTKEQDTKEYNEWRKRVLSASGSSTSSSSSSSSSTSSTSGPSSSISGSSSSDMLHSVVVPAPIAPSAPLEHSLSSSMASSGLPSATNHCDQPPKKKQKKKQMTLFGSVPSSMPPVPAMNTMKKAKKKISAKQQAKENALNVSGVDEHIEALNALLN